MKRTPFLLSLGIFVLILGAIYGGYSYYQRSSLKTELVSLGNGIEGYRQKELDYANQDLLGAVNARTVLNALEGKGVKWSGVIRDINKTIPENKNGDELVEVLSYSAGSTQEINMSMKTVPNTEDAYADVADLIEAFDKSDYFVDSFVPSLSGGEDSSGRSVLTFSMGTKYAPKTVNPAENEPIISR